MLAISQGGYRPCGRREPKYREVNVHSLKIQGMTNTLWSTSIMASYFPLDDDHRATHRCRRLYCPADFSCGFAGYAVALRSGAAEGIAPCEYSAGERGPQVRGSVYEWPSSTSSALDTLLSEIQFASDQRSRMDTLIRSYAAQDNKTGHE